MGRHKGQNQDIKRIVQTCEGVTVGLGAKQGPTVRTIILEARVNPQKRSRSKSLSNHIYIEGKAEREVTIGEMPL